MCKKERVEQIKIIDKRGRVKRAKHINAVPYKRPKYKFNMEYDKV